MSAQGAKATRKGNSMRIWFRSHPKLSIFLGILAAITILFLILAFRPFTLRESFTPNPAEYFTEAQTRIKSIQAAEAELPDLF